MTKELIISVKDVHHKQTDHSMQLGYVNRFLLKNINITRLQAQTAQHLSI